MTYGLRCWNSAGELIVDISDRLTRYHSSHSVVVGPSAFDFEGFVSVAGMDASDKWFLFSSVGGKALCRAGAGGFDWLLTTGDRSYTFIVTVMLTS